MYTFPPDYQVPTVDIMFVDDSGLPVTGLLAATIPTISIDVGQQSTSRTITLSDLAQIYTPWTAGGIKERGNGVYRLDLPIFDDIEVTAKLRADATDKHLIGLPIKIGIKPVVGWYGDKSVVKAFRSIKDRRGTFFGMGDSGQTHSGNGIDRGTITALSNIFGFRWAAQVSCGMQGGASYLANNATPNPLSGAPAALNKYLPSAGAIGPNAYQYIPPGTTTGGTGGIFITATGNKYNVNTHSRLDVWIGTTTATEDPTNAGQVWPGMRERGSFTWREAPGYIKTRAAGYGLQLISVDIPANFAGGNDLEGGVFNPAGGSGHPITGPAFSTYIRMTDLNLLKGWEYSTFLSIANSIVANAGYLRTMTPEFFQHYFSLPYNGQKEVPGAKPVFFFEITGGLHQDDTQNSPHGYPANTVEGMMDGLDDTISYLKQIFATNYPDAEVYFIIRMEHVMNPAWNAAEIDQISAYRSRIKRYVQTVSGVVFVDQYELYTLDMMLAASLFFAADGSNSSHLERAGYDLCSQLIYNCLWTAGAIELYDTDLDRESASLAAIKAQTDKVGTTLGDSPTVTTTIPALIQAVAPSVLGDPAFTGVANSASDAALYSIQAAGSAAAAASSSASAASAAAVAVTQTASLRASNIQSATTVTAVLDAGASAVTGAYVGMRLDIGNDSRTITAYDGTTKTATVVAWSTVPSNGAAYKLRQATAGGSGTRVISITETDAVIS